MNEKITDKELINTLIKLFQVGDIIRFRLVSLSADIIDAGKIVQINKNDILIVRKYYYHLPFENFIAFEEKKDHILYHVMNPYEY